MPFFDLSNIHGRFDFALADSRVGRPAILTFFYLPQEISLSIAAATDKSRPI